MRLFIVGNRGDASVGHAFWRAARYAGIPVAFADMRLAFGGGRLIQALAWKLGRYPIHTNAFSHAVEQRVKEHQTDVLLTTGIAPITHATLNRLARHGIRIINYATDDPWNPVHRASRFLQSLPAYHAVFTPRTANLEDFTKAGVRNTQLLPFGFEPRYCFPFSSKDAECPGVECDVLFVGGADADRAELLAPLLRSDLKVWVYGGYWDDYPLASKAHRGQANLDTICKATRSARVVLCLVRRANRDGHTMRTYEAAAIGACLLVEDTAEHRALFGPVGARVSYFQDGKHLLAQAYALLSLSGHERQRRIEAVRRLMWEGGHTYADRLREMLEKQAILTG